MLGFLGLIALVENGPTRPQSFSAILAGAQSISPPLDDDIVVFGRRRAEPKADLEINEDEIAKHGADTIRELLGDLQPFLDPSGNPTTILVNGKLVNAADAILGFPVEALTKITVLTPSAGRALGAQAGGRVINLVLKSKFGSTEVEGAVNGATAGGQSGGNVGASRSAVDGETRWTVGLQYGRQGSLLRSSRLIPATEAVGEQSRASLVSKSANGSFQTLQPAIRSAAANFGVTRSMGRFSVTIGIDAAWTASDSMAGLPMLFVPNPSYSGASLPTDAIRLVGVRPLQSQARQQTLAISMSLSGIALGSNINVAASLAGGRGRTASDLAFEDASVARLMTSWNSFDGGTVYYRDAYADMMTMSRTAISNVMFSTQRTFVDRRGKGTPLAG